MNVQPKPGYTGIVKVLDAANPFLILFATIGIFLDYSPLKSIVALPNDIIGALFAIDFIIRMFSFPAARYLVRGWGWIDFLASLPGFLVFVQATPLVSLLRIVRVGRFFRIIRVLRFLRAFSFLKTMKSDSVWMQDRIMKIGVTVVFTSMIGIVALDLGSQNLLEKLASRPYRAAWSASSGSMQSLSGMPEVVAVVEFGTVRATGRPGLPPVATPMDWVLARNTLSANLLEIDLAPGSGQTVDGASLPMTGVLLVADDMVRAHDTVMTIAIATLLAILLAIMFIVGAIFARDLQTIQLVVDSFDAGDYMLLREHATVRGFSGENALVDPDEDEMDNLLKAAVSAADQMEGSAGAGMGGLSGLVGQGRRSAGWSGGADEDGPEGTGLSQDDIDTLADAVADRVAERILPPVNDSLSTVADTAGRRAAMDTIRSMSPSIVKYLKGKLGV